MKMQLLILSFVVLVSNLSFGETPQKFVELKKPGLLYLSPGKTTQAVFKIEVLPGLHVQSNPAALPNLRPTSLTFANQGGVEFEAATYPAGKPYRMLNSIQDISVYEGVIELKIPVKAVSAKVGKLELKGELKYQACNDKICFFPKTEPVIVQAQVLKK